MDNNLLAEAINLTLFGMGFVFVFLALMVVLTSLMSTSVLNCLLCEERPHGPEWYQRRATKNDQQE